jgi:hypothetical protein
MVLDVSVVSVGGIARVFKPRRAAVETLLMLRISLCLNKFAGNPNPDVWSSLTYKLKREWWSINYNNWKCGIPRGPILDILWLYIMWRRMVNIDCLDAVKLHQKWGNRTVPPPTSGSSSLSLPTRESLDHI